jgi:hypothetical protein
MKQVFSFLLSLSIPLFLFGQIDTIRAKRTPSVHKVSVVFLEKSNLPIMGKIGALQDSSILLLTFPGAATTVMPINIPIPKISRIDILGKPVPLAGFLLGALIGGGIVGILNSQLNQGGGPVPIGPLIGAGVVGGLLGMPIFRFKSEKVSLTINGDQGYYIINKPSLAQQVQK